MFIHSFFVWKIFTSWYECLCPIKKVRHSTPPAVCCGCMYLPNFFKKNPGFSLRTPLTNPKLRWWFQTFVNVHLYLGSRYPFLICFNWVVAQPPNIRNKSCHLLPSGVAGWHAWVSSATGTRGGETLETPWVFVGSLKRQAACAVRRCWSHLFGEAGKIYKLWYLGQEGSRRKMWIWRLILKKQTGLSLTQTLPNQNWTFTSIIIYIIWVLISQIRILQNRWWFQTRWFFFGRGPTPLKTNIAPENRPSQKETSIPTINFQVLC